jgi:hypothetical protein
MMKTAHLLMAAPVVAARPPMVELAGAAAHLQTAELVGVSL